MIEYGSVGTEQHTYVHQGVYVVELVYVVVAGLIVTMAINY